MSGDFGDVVVIWGCGFVPGMLFGAWVFWGALKKKLREGGIKI